LAGQIYYESEEERIALFSLVTGEYKVFPGAGGYPVWLSDGRRLLFRRGAKLMLLDAVTGSVRDILFQEGDVYDMFDLSRDDRTIYFNRLRAEADIWMATLDETER
jgi:hypothetical protein